MSNNKLKKLGIIVSSVLIGLYVLFLISPLVVSPIIDSYSDNIEDSLKSATGFDVDLDDIAFTTGWNLSAGVKAKNITLTIPAAETPFFKAENAGARIALLPFLARKIQIDSVFAKNIDGEFGIKQDGNFLALDYLPKSEASSESFVLPLGLKLSNHLPNVNVKNYKLSLLDIQTDKSYYVEGSDLKVSDFILDKKVKFKTNGKVVFDNNIISNYDLKVYNKIMPDISLQDMVFPQDVVVDDEKPVIKSTSGEFNIIESLNAVKNNQLRADIFTDIKTAGTVKNPNLKGNVKLDAISVAVDGKKLPESYIDLKFKGNKTDIDSIFFSSIDTNEKTQLIGNVKSGKKPAIDLTLRSNAKFNNIIRLVDSVAESFGMKDFETLTATGGIDADFNINSDMKKVLSTGYLKVMPSSLKYGLYNVSIDNITADVDMMNNNIDFKKAGFSILNHPLNLSGHILADSTADLKLTADKVSLKGLLMAFGQGALLKENDVKAGVVSLNALIKGKLMALKPEIFTDISDINVENIPSATGVVLDNALVKILYDGKTASGNVDINSLVINNPSAVVSVPKTNVLIDSKDINIKNSYLMLNNSRVDIKGAVKNYINDKMNIDIAATGNLNSADIAAVLPADFRNLISYQGKLPLNINITGNAKAQNIKINLKADKNNYVSLIDADALKGQDTKIHSNIEIIGDSLSFSNTGISNDKTTLAKLSGEVTKLYSSPRLNLNIAVPNEISFPIWGVPNSNITANGSVSVIGDAMNPNMRGTINLVDISMKDFDFAIKDLVADLSGKILNGTATARQFKSAGIVATDLSGTFSLKDYSKFYLTDLSGKAFDGDVKGKLSYDINTSKIGLELIGNGLNSTKAVEGAVGIKNALTGVLVFSTKLTMQGLTDKEIIQSMKGNVDFNIDDGKFLSIGRLENLILAQNVSSNSVLKSALSAMSTFATVQEADKFKYIKGNMTLASGSANLSKIIVAGPLMAYHVHGTYNILSNSANLIILGRLESKVVSVLGPLGDLTAEKLLSYIPKFGAMTSNILKQLTSDPANENTALIPELTNGSKSYKDFKVVFNGPVESSSSVKSFKWLSTCDTSEMNLKQDLQNAKDAVKSNITDRVENAKNNAENVKNNVNKIIETQKNKAETAKKDIEQVKTDIQNVKENSKQNVENLKNLFKNAVQNAGQKVQPVETPTE